MVWRCAKVECSRRRAPKLASAMTTTHKISVLAAAILFIADNVGTGILALPGQAEALGGRTGGVALIIVFAPLCWYVAIALHRAAMLVERRDAELLASDGARPLINDLYGLAAALYSPNACIALVTAFLYYSTLFLQMASYLIVLSQALQKIVGALVPFCRPWAGLATALLLLVSNQLPSMAAVARGPAGLSVLGVVAVVVICVTFAAKTAAAPLVPPSPPPSRSPFETALDRGAAVGGVIFAEAVTMLLLNSRQALREPNRVGTALAIALSGMCIGFTAVVVCSGPHPPPFLLDAIPHGEPSWQRVASSLLFVHVAISYAISSVALCTAIQRLPLLRRRGASGTGGKQPSSSSSSDGMAGAPAGIDVVLSDENRVVNGSEATAAASSSCWRERLEWACLTSVVMLMAWLLANAAPFFAALVDFIGSLNLCTFFLPCLFLRRAHHLTRTPLPLWEKALTAVLMLASVAMTFVGCSGSIFGIVRSWRHYGVPFACHAV